MNKLCQQYLSDVRAIFPIMGKPERKYLAKLANTVEDYCMEEKAATIEEIYSGFGTPSELASTYFTSVDSSKLIKRIRYTKWIKRGFFVLLFIALVCVSIFGITTYKAYKVFEQEQFYYGKTEIY